jgi:hypothetical protein
MRIPRKGNCAADACCYLASFFPYRRSGKNTRYDLNIEMWFGQGPAWQSLKQGVGQTIEK